MTAAEIVAATRAAQGLPPTIQDPAVLAAALDLLNGATPAGEAGAADASSAGVAGRVARHG